MSNLHHLCCQLPLQLSRLFQRKILFDILLCHTMDLRKRFSNPKTLELRLLAENVLVVKGAAFLEVAVNGVASPNEFPLADPKQVVHEHVAVEKLQLQSVTFLGVKVHELLLPPGVFVVVAHSCFTQSDGAEADFDVAVSRSQEIRGKVAGFQVKHSYLSFSHAQTAQEQKEEGETAGHGVGKKAVQK